MKKYPFDQVVIDCTSKFHKIKKENYLPTGQYKIVDQGKEFIAGYTNDKDLLNALSSPIIIFGDHTKIFKYTDFPLALGADGAKALTIKNNLAYSKYLYFYFKTLKLTDAGYSRHFKFLKEVSIPLPENYDDQIRIATVLSRAEKLIAKRKESIKALDELLKSNFLEMFGDTSKFEWKTIGDIADKKKKYSISSGPFGSNLTSKHYTNSGVLVLRGTNISSGKLKLDDVKYISEETAIGLKRSALQAGDVVIIAVGSSGQALRIPDGISKMIMSQNFNKISPDFSIINPIYLEFCINSEYMQGQFKKQITDTVRTFLSLTKIKSISIPVPPLSLQNQFAAIVEKVENIKTRYNQNFTELENLYGSLSQRAFKGELDLSKVPVEKESK